MISSVSSQLGHGRVKLVAVDESWSVEIYDGEAFVRVFLTDNDHEACNAVATLRRALRDAILCDRTVHHSNKSRSKHIKPM